MYMHVSTTTCIEDMIVWMAAFAAVCEFLCATSCSRMNDKHVIFLRPIGMEVFLINCILTEAFHIQNWLWSNLLIMVDITSPHIKCWCPPSFFYRVFWKVVTPLTAKIVYHQLKMKDLWTRNVGGLVLTRKNRITRRKSFSSSVYLATKCQNYDTATFS
jgi:hypothetical protein